MLKLAFDYKEAVNKAYRDCLLDRKNLRAFACSYSEYTILIDDDDWKKRQLVSVSNDDILNGFFQAEINRTINAVEGIFIFSTYTNKLEFAKDLMMFFRGLLNDFDKINFYVIRGHYTEKHYDNLVQELGGRIIGTFYRDVKLMDGSFADKKYYEIFKS